MVDYFTLLGAGKMKHGDDISGRIPKKTRADRASELYLEANGPFLAEYYPGY